MLGVSEESIRLLDWNSRTTWYDVEQFRDTIREVGSFDFALIDGPGYSNGQTRGIRDNDAALAEIRRCLPESEVVIVDDVHRLHILDTVDAMLGEPNRYEKWFYDYPVIKDYLNTLCICVKKASQSSAELGKIRSLVDVPLYMTFKRENCSEE
jgi:hypothetical protein